MTARRSAFSLLELAVVLVLLSLVVGFGVNIGQNAVKHSTRLAMLEKMSLIKQALDDYANRNGYLPCPANPQLLPSNPLFGQQNRNFVAGAGCENSGGVFNADNVWFGMLPVQSLGLDDSYAVDEWGNKLTYAVSENHIGTNAADRGFSSYATQQGTIIVDSNTIAVPVRLSTTFTGAPGTGATYVVVSHGKNARGAYPLNGTAPIVACSGSIEAENCDRTNRTFFDAEYNEGNQATTQFDDYVVWGSNATSRNPVNFLPNACPSSTICEAWCAPCETGGRSMAPNITPTRLCAKFITRNQPSCEARCIWPTATMPCP